MDPAFVGTAASLATESIDLLKSAIGVLPADGGNHQAPRAERMKAYIAFQRAAHEASVWPGWLGVLEQFSYTKGATTGQVLPDLAGSRDATVELLAVLGQIRLVGSPEPRRIAEEIVTLLVELMESRVPGVPNSSVRFQFGKWVYKKANREAIEMVRPRVPRLAAQWDEAAIQVDDELRKARQAQFRDCQLALGRWHRKFTLAARKDLGYGPRFWHFGKKPRRYPWQIWRPYDPWPGGWPPRDAKEIVADARRERLADESERKEIKSSGERCAKNLT